MDRAQFDPAVLLREAPSLPGVYLMKDGDGEIIYIGKATSLKKRLSSYFQKTAHDVKTATLVRHIRSVEYIVTDSEIEALLLESSLIGKHRPKYNVRLKDDKRYPYIAVTMSEEYPRIVFTRKMSRGGDRYFGPYTDARAARGMAATLNSAFRLKTCKKKIPLSRGERPCLNYQMNRCHGPCMGKITVDEYRKIVSGAVEFLEGDIYSVTENMRKLMNEHSSKFEYEQAARIRDVMEDIAKITESQKVFDPVGRDRDYAAMAIRSDEALVVLFEFRGGVLLGRKVRVFENAQYASPEDIMRAFLVDYYRTTEIPPSVVVMNKVHDRQIIEEYLSSRAGRRVAILTPKTGDDHAVMNLLRKNIDVLVSDRESRRHHDGTRSGLEELAAVTGAQAAISTIECFDISNTQGTLSVASMVRFRDGNPDRSRYRRFRIKGYSESNDPGMIHEVVSRRIQHLLNENQQLPDLLVIDGGPTQLARALEAVSSLEAKVPVISLAKRFEEIYTQPKEKPLRLPSGSVALKILQRIRDEAHRFAITYHRTLRDGAMTASALDGIDGIGEQRKRILLEHMKSVEAIGAASIDEIASVPGIGKAVAQAVFDHFHRGRNESESG
jgi:excinuclease ABC subunit C